MTQSSSDSNGHGAGGMPNDAGNGTTKQKIKEDVRDAKHEAGAQAREQAKAGQHRVANEADNLSDAIDAAASSLDDHDREGLARYARELSSSLSNAAGQLEGRSIDELANDAKRLARNNPALFMLGSIGVGFGLSRFFKASSDRNHEGKGSDSRSDTRPAEGAIGDELTSNGPLAQRREPTMTDTSTTSGPRHNGDGRDAL